MNPSAPGSDLSVHGVCGRRRSRRWPGKHCVCAPGGFRWKRAWLTQPCNSEARWNVVQSGVLSQHCVSKAHWVTLVLLRWLITAVRPCSLVRLGTAGEAFTASPISSSSRYQEDVAMSVGTSFEQLSGHWQQAITPTMSSNTTQGDGSSDSTSIWVSVPVRDELFSRKNPGDSYDTVLRRVLDMPVSDEEN
ncbi:hypothetical protein Natoc_4372 (plasmid) [Natronococcus occultus SP4]|uniref:Uncharacterized protein n=1 Tax=Natronococcus occultus SP4 TaxID=694430 RepID=L0K3E8_9EURY|nr:hypothetical protein Natoc_4372 [Natronococcus occultus SP4]